MKLYIHKIRSGPRKGELYYKLFGGNGEFIIGLRPETLNNRADLEHNLDLVSRIREAEVIDLTGDEVEAL